MIQLIAFIIFLVSIGIVIFILYKKFPILNELPHDGHHGIKKPKFVSDIEHSIKENYRHFFKNRAILHKPFSKLWILTLKFERMVHDALTDIRKRTQKPQKKTSKRKK
ncbi:MAG: hypothetical protein AAB877_00520 [Patescibacteria group bacterium]